MSRPKGFHHTEETKAKMRKPSGTQLNPHNLRGKDHPNWTNGESYLYLNGEFLSHREIYKRLLKSQGNFCAICGKSETTIHPSNGKIQRLSIDHNHETGEVRGLLCSNCNLGLGFFGDDIRFLENAKKYLIGFKKHAIHTLET